MATEELTQLISARVTPAEAAHAKHLGAGSASAGIRRSLLLSQQLQQTGSAPEPAARLSQLLEQALPLARALEQSADADATSTSSGAAWLPKPTGDLILKVREATGAAVVAMPDGLMSYGEGPSGSAAALSVDMANGQLAITDLSREADLEEPLDLPGLAALVDGLGEVKRQARIAVAKGRKPSEAVAEVPGLNLKLRAADERGAAVLQLGDAQFRLHALTLLILHAECAALLARSVGRSLDQRAALEQLLQPVELAGVRSHGEG